MQRVLAIIERELRRFRRSPALIVMSLTVPIVQLVILGYAFGGNVRHLVVGVVDQDHGLPAVKLRELAGAVAVNAGTFETQQFSDLGEAVHALREGEIQGVLTIPPGFSRRVLAKQSPRVALIEDNTDGFVGASLVASLSGLVTAYGQPRLRPQLAAATPSLDVVEIYPYVPYIQYLLPGSIVMSIFMMVMIGGGIIFIDDKARGLHEGYLVTPITRLELILGFNISGALKAVLSGLVLMTIGTLIAGVPDPFEPLRLLRVFCVIVATAIALVSMMFLIMVRMNDPLLPRAMFGVLNTLLYFPSGAVYPQYAFPGWLRVIAAADPFTYAVHALKCLLLKNTGFSAIAADLTFLLVFGTVSMLLAAQLFRENAVKTQVKKPVVRKTAAPKRARGDLETRERLLDAAIDLFAERGFDNVTVRDISSEAGANLAAISYHFGDKLGLYAQIVEIAIERMRGLNDSCIEQTAAFTPQDKLRHFVATYLPRMARPQGRDGLVQRLMRHEMAESTELARRVVKLAILPRVRFLSSIVAELIACPLEDPRVQLCVASVQAQCSFYARGALHAPLLSHWSLSSDAEVQSAVEHVTQFSLAGIRAAAKRGAG